MSHFVVMVIGDNPEQQLAPYDENLEVPEYLVEEVSEHDKQRMLDYYNENREKPYTDFDKCYADTAKIGTATDFTRTRTAYGANTPPIIPIPNGIGIYSAVAGAASISN